MPEFDRQGPDTGVDWKGRRGFPCDCQWSSRLHGDLCPEHGKVGVPIVSEFDRAAAEAAVNHGFLHAAGSHGTYAELVGELANHLAAALAEHSRLAAENARLRAERDAERE